MEHNSMWHKGKITNNLYSLKRKFRVTEFCLEMNLSIECSWSIPNLGENYAHLLLRKINICVIH